MRSSDKGKNKTKRNSIDVYTSVGYMLRIDCWEAEREANATLIIPGQAGRKQQEERKQKEKEEAEEAKAKAVAEQEKEAKAKEIGEYEKMELSKIATEKRNENTLHIDELSTRDMVKLINDEDKKVAEAVEKELVAELGERAEDVRNRLVEPREDNMLKITSDGRRMLEQITPPFLV